MRQSSGDAGASVRCRSNAVESTEDRADLRAGLQDDLPAPAGVTFWITPQIATFAREQSHSRAVERTSLR
jgi:hypothetical protein